MSLIGACTSLDCCVFNQASISIPNQPRPSGFRKMSKTCLTTCVSPSPLALLILMSQNYSNSWGSLNRQK